MLEPHSHDGLNSPRINADLLLGPSVITADAISGVSALRTIAPTVMQRGFYTLTTGVKLVTFPQIYSETTTLHVFVASTDTPNATHTLQGVVASAFTVSGSGSEKGHWFSLGYK